MLDMCILAIVSIIAMVLIYLGSKNGKQRNNIKHL